MTAVTFLVHLHLLHGLSVFKDVKKRFEPTSEENSFQAINSQ